MGKYKRKLGSRKYADYDPDNLKRAIEEYKQKQTSLQTLAKKIWYLKINNSKKSR